MNSPKFCTKDGYLTAYAMACGYLETNLNYSNEEFGKRIYIEMDCGVYHVKGYDHNEHCSLGWQCFDNIKDARKAFNMLCRENGDVRKFNV